MPDAIQQQNADFIFELLYRLADGRLRREHDFGCLRKAALPYHFDEGSQRSYLHPHSISEISLLRLLVDPHGGPKTAVPERKPEHG
jgi:hypothetical protein